MKAIAMYCALMLGAGLCPAGILVDPGGEIDEIVADPVRDVFYVTLATNEIVAFGADGAIDETVTAPGNVGMMAVARDGSELYVALLDSHDVAVYLLPGLTYRTTFDLSATETGPTGLAAKAGRLYAVSDDGLAVVDTVTGDELYFDEPAGALSPFYSSLLALSPNGKTLYALDTSLSPASLFVYDVSTDLPAYMGEDCCHGCIGSNGSDLDLSPNGARVYVAAGAPYYFQVLKADPMIHEEHAILTGPYPRAVVASADGSRVYLGYYGPKFAVARTSDWLPFHEGALQGYMVRRGLALSSSQTTLAAVIEYQGLDPNRIELVNVTSPVANRGGVRVRPLDDLTGVPPGGGSVSTSPSGGAGGRVDVKGGLLGRAPLLPGAVSVTVTATGHTTQNLNAAVVAGAWTDLGDLTMARSGASLASPADVCVSPAGLIGATSQVQVHGLGFLPGAGFEVTSNLAAVTVESFSFVDWATANVTLSVDPALTPGLKFSAIRVTNPDTQFEYGDLIVKISLFADGFELGDTSRWSDVVP